MNSAQVDFDIIAEIEDQRRRNFRVKIVREALAGPQLNHRRPFVRPIMPHVASTFGRKVLSFVPYVAVVSIASLPSS